MSILKPIKKFWNFIWNGKGVLSWLAFLVFSFVFLSIAYPLFLKFLSLFGVADIVAVVSSSMVHEPSIEATAYTAWLDRNGYDSNETGLWPLPGGLNPGDVAVVMSSEPGEIKVGDVIVYKTSEDTPIIHRVVEIDKENGRYYFTTKGDANAGIFPFERQIQEEKVVGKVSVSIPFLGVPKMLLVKFLMLFK